MLLRNIRQAVCTQVDAPWKPVSQVQLTGGKLIVYGNGLAGEIDGVLGTNIDVQVTVQTGMLQRTNPLPYQECRRHMRNAKRDRPLPRTAACFLLAGKCMHGRQ